MRAAASSPGFRPVFCPAVCAAAGPAAGATYLSAQHRDAPSHGCPLAAIGSELGRAAAAAIPQARLVEFADLGHAPQIQAPDRFHKALLDGLLPPGPAPGR